MASAPTSEPSPPEFLFTELGFTFIFPFFAGTGASKPSVGTDAAYCMQGLAAVAVSRGEPGRAARLLGAAEALLETAGIPLYAQVDLELHQRAADAAREQLGERAWTAAWDEGRVMSFEEAVAYAREGDEALPTARTWTPASE